MLQIFSGHIHWRWGIWHRPGRTWPLRQSPHHSFTRLLGHSETAPERIDTGGTLAQLPSMPTPILGQRVLGLMCLATGLAACSSSVSTTGSGGGVATTTSSMGTGGSGSGSGAGGASSTTSTGAGGASSSSSSGSGGGSGCAPAGVPPCPLWSKRFGDASSQDLVAMAGDGAGGLYLLGTFSGSIDFGGGALISSSRAVFLTKLDAAGNHVWSRAIRSVAANDSINPAEVAVDAGSNLIIAGDSSGPVDFGTGAVNPPDPGSAAANTFVAKFGAAAGDFQWAWFPGVAYAPGNYGQADCVAVAPAGAVYVGNETDGPPPSFLSMLDPAGAPAWSAKYSGSLGTDVRPLRIAATSGGAPVVVGQYLGAPDLGGGPLPSSNGFGLFLAGLSQGGAFQWAHAWPSFSVTPNALANDATGDVYVTGHFAPPMDFGNGAIGAGIADEIFLIRVSQGGTTVWSKAFDNPVTSMPVLALAKNGDVLLAGDSYQPVDFGAGPIPGQDMWLTAFSPSGESLWSRGFGTTPGGDLMKAIVATPSGVALAGTLRGAVDFGGGALQTAGEGDIFVAAFGL